jgi:hypothetical protein
MSIGIWHLIVLALVIVGAITVARWIIRRFRK